jgi:hypothetical protein
MRQLMICMFFVTSLGSGCGGGEDEVQPPSGEQEEIVAAATGGTVTAEGATLEIPAGALAQDTAITVVAASPGAGMPEASTVRGMVYDFGPDGTTFSKQAKLTLPMAGTPAAGERAVISWLDPVSNRWVNLSSTVAGGTISASVAHFTSFALRIVKVGVDG